MKIAIAQDKFIKGGRLRWLASFIWYLNRKGIEPDVISYEMPFDGDEIYRSYGIPVRFRIRNLERPGF